MTLLLTLLLQAGLAGPSWGGAPFSPRLIHLPAGFHIDLYADHLPDACSMAAAPGGILFVGSRKAGRV